MRTTTESKKLPLMEHFYTIQGEGYYAGRAAYFIRLGGCDVGCVWCDVKESWNAATHPLTDIETIIHFVKGSQTKLVVITGGEPALYNLSGLVDALKILSYEVAIETSGCYSLKGEVDWYCFSPKKFKNPIQEAYEKASELKVVIFHPSDITWAETHADKINSNCLLFLQPEWSKKEEMMPLIIEYVKIHPEWKISLQTHKYLNIP